MAQLKDLLVLGASRFLNIIHGSIDGNAATASKVNNKLSITLFDESTKEFDGSNAVAIDLSTALTNMAFPRFVGESVEKFGKDEFDNFYCILTDSSSTHVIPIVEVYNAPACKGDGTTNYNIGGTNYKYFFVPSVGDIIKVGAMELICTGLGTGNGGRIDTITVGTTDYTKFSRWAILGNNEVWGTY